MSTVASKDTIQSQRICEHRKTDQFDLVRANTKKTKQNISLNLIPRGVEMLDHYTVCNVLHSVHNFSLVALETTDQYAN